MSFSPRPLLLWTPSALCQLYADCYSLAEMIVSNCTEAMSEEQGMTWNARLGSVLCVQRHVDELHQTSTKVLFSALCHGNAGVLSLISSMNGQKFWPTSTVLWTWAQVSMWPIKWPSTFLLIRMFILYSTTRYAIHQHRPSACPVCYCEYKIFKFNEASCCVVNNWYRSSPI